MCIYIYIYIYIYRERERCMCVYIYIYIYIYICICICLSIYLSIYLNRYIYIYIYIYRERYNIHIIHICIYTSYIGTVAQTANLPGPSLAAPAPARFFVCLVKVLHVASSTEHLTSVDCWLPLQQRRLKSECGWGRAAH